MVDLEIEGMMQFDEKILMRLHQSRIRPGGSIITPNTVFITNRRIILKDPRWLGLKADIEDIAYQDISNIRLNPGIFSTEIILKSRFLSDEIALPAVSKQKAREVMDIIQTFCRIQGFKTRSVTI
jgi:Bacterial PH domain